MADDPPPSPLFLARYAGAAGSGGLLRFDQFMQVALYDEEVGYYRSDKERVGYGPAADFYTATTSGTLFGELIAAACLKLLGPDRVSRMTFVEIGSEPSGGVLAGVSHPFAAFRTIPLGTPIAFSGDCVVFSNELFDAQPFRRFVRVKSGWEETWVQLHNGGLKESTKILSPVEAEALRDRLPDTLPPGYRLDLPLASVNMCASILQQPWTGLFLAFDYGKTWRELVEACPAGTARAYHQHTQYNDLLARPGHQDLTCHVCWDWLETCLREHGCTATHLESQEAFFIHHAGDFIGPTLAQEAARFSQRKLALMQLLHPSHMGQKFQVLWGQRP